MNLRALTSAATTSVAADISRRKFSSPPIKAQRGLTSAATDHSFSRRFGALPASFFGALQGLAAAVGLLAQFRVGRFEFETVG